MQKTKTRVLLVDDDGDDHLIIRSLLTKLAGRPFELDWCPDYDSGLAAIQERRHEVYLIDYRMGEQTGLELITASDVRERSQPFIILTGAGDENIERRAMAIGTADYLVKGTFDAELLSRVIRHSMQRREMEMQRIDELMTVSKSKDEFIALASHQLRTPATGVKQYVGMLIEGYAGPLSDEQKMLLQSAYRSNERQLHIVNDILRVAQVDLNKITMHQEATELGRLMEDILAEQQVEFSTRSQKLHYKKPTIPIKAALDTDHFRMAVGNIISNASKYTPEGKEISVRVNASADKATIEVRDQGVGISPNDQAKLFQKFSRIDNPLSVQAGGSGLGLYLAKKIIEQHGGDIEVTSAPNEGTTFIITVPAV
jgi:two-component system sensor histidine kinase/response regulator